MENIMFDVESSEVRFVDFGLACIRGGKCTGGTSGYIAPEVKDMFYPTIRDERADIYALGLTLAQVILDDTRINKTVIRNEIKSKKLQNLLLDMLKTDYKKREFANTLLEKYFPAK
jgi:serine/threonine protein kinase